MHMLQIGTRKVSRSYAELPETTSGATIINRDLKESSN
jgi:hypothetical protein